MAYSRDALLENSKRQERDKTRERLERDQRETRERLERDQRETRERLKMTKHLWGLVGSESFPYMNMEYLKHQHRKQKQLL